MIDKEQLKIVANSPEIYKGAKNTAIRYYLYTQKGLGIINEFRYIVICIVGACVALKISDPMIMIGIFFASIPLLITLGFVSIHHMDKIIEFLNMRHATTFGKYSFEMQERNTDNLQKIRELLETRKGEL